MCDVYKCKFVESENDTWKCLKCKKVISSETYITLLEGQICSLERDLKIFKKRVKNARRNRK